MKTVLIIRRYRPIATGLLWLIGWAVAINLVLLALAQAGALDWLPDRQTGTGFVQDNQQRVDAALAEYRVGAVPTSDTLVAVTGISNVREGVDVDVLRERLGPGVRVLGVAGAGAGAPSIVENANTILLSDLRPDLVVLGIAPLQMLDTFGTPALTTQEAPTQPALRDRLRGWAHQGVWLFARRNDISIAVERTLLVLRATTFKAFGVRLETPDIRSPWRPMMHVMGAEHYPDSVLRRGVAWAGGIGAFDSSAYQRSARAPALLASLIRRLRSRCSHVVVIVTPEHSWLRKREPAHIVDRIAKRLRVEAEAPDLRTLDFRAVIPDQGFVDLSHLNSSGRRAFSVILADAIGELDETSQPLMAPPRRNCAA